MIVTDASVLIAHLDESDAQHTSAEALLLEAADRPLAASTVTLGEVLVGPVRGDRIPDATQALDALGVHEVEVASGTAPRLATLRASTRLRLPDCCVLLAAQETDAAGLLTLDERLAAAAKRLGLMGR